MPGAEGRIRSSERLLLRRSRAAELGDDDLGEIDLKRESTMSSIAEDPTKKPPVLLLDGGIRSLSVVRSLAKHGVRVYCFDTRQNWGRYSRYSKRIRGVGASYKEWMDWLRGEGLPQFGGSVIFPCSDTIMEMTARHRSELEAHYILPEGKDDVVLAMLDKGQTYPLAQQCGVPVPRCWAVSSSGDVESIIENVSFPCALKPRYSHDFRSRGVLHKLFVVQDKDDLTSKFLQLQTLGREGGFRADVLITEVIPGEDEERFRSFYSYIDEDGVPLLQFTKRKLRQYPNLSGYGTYHLTDWSPETAELGLRFFKGVGYYGFGCIEFKRDPRDGVLKLMECNARLTNATELLRKSDFDIALFVYNRLTRRPLPDMRDYRRGESMIRPLRDFLAFRNAHKRGLLSWGQWLRSVLRAHHFEAFSWRDPLPSIMMAAHRAGRSWTALKGNRWTAMKGNRL